MASIVPSQLGKGMRGGFALVALLLSAFAFQILATPDVVMGPGHARMMMSAAAPSAAPDKAVSDRAGLEKALAQRADRPCAFPGHNGLPRLRCCCTRFLHQAIQPALPSLLAPVVVIVTLLAPPATPIALAPEVMATPGRSMAAPPPRSHAPPSLRR